MNKGFLSAFLYSLLIFASVACKVSDTTHSTATDTFGGGFTNEINRQKEKPLGLTYQAEKTRYFQLIHTKLDLKFDWENQYVDGLAVVDVKPYFYPQDTLKLDAKGFEVQYVHLVKGKKKHSLKYFYDNEVLRIALGDFYTRNDTISVEVKYIAKPNERAIKGSDAIISDKGLYFINPDGTDPDKPRQIWTQGETEANSAWFPTIDSPNQKSTQETYITVEDNFKTLSNGVLVYSRHNEDNTRTDYWKMDKPHAPYLFMIAVGEFAVVEDRWKNIDVDYYVEPEFEKYAKKIFGSTPEMITFFSEKLNYPFPWQKYAQVVVRDFVSGAMENTTASVFMEALQVDDRHLVDENWEGIIAHELFHQWFGNVVTTESWSNLPLNESFANYGEYLWYEYKYGKDEADYHAMEETEKYLNEAEQKQVDLIRFFYDDKEDMFDSHSYAKGGRILHMLRNYVGDEAFFKSLEYYLKTHEYSAVEVHHLRLAFEKVTGKDLNWFFNQWFLAAGHPKLEVQHRYNEGVLTVYVKQNQDIAKFPLYILPLTIDVWENGEKRSFPVVVSNQHEEFRFKVSGQPELVLFDGEQQLLAEIEHRKSLEECIFQYKNSDKLKARIAAITELLRFEESDQVVETLLYAMNDKAWPVRQAALTFLEEYMEDYFDIIEPAIVRMATEDEKTLVRADALAILASLNADEYIELFRKGLVEESYAVVGASLFGYMLSTEPDIEMVVESFEDYTNSNVYLPIASMYSENGKIEKYDWFLSKIKMAQSTDLYYLLQLFGELIAGGDPEQKEEGIALLYDHAINNKTYFVRLAAFQGLLLLSDEESVVELQKDIIKKEKDPRLKNIYATFEF